MPHLYQAFHVFIYLCGFFLVFFYILCSGCSVKSDNILQSVPQCLISIKGPQIFISVGNFFQSFINLKLWEYVKTVIQ